MAEPQPSCELRPLADIDPILHAPARLPAVAIHCRVPTAGPGLRRSLACDLMQGSGCGLALYYQFTGHARLASAASEVRGAAHRRNSPGITLREFRGVSQADVARLEEAGIISE